MEEKNSKFYFLSNKQIDGILESYIRHYRLTDSLSKHFFEILDEKLRRNEIY